MQLGERNQVVKLPTDCGVQSECEVLLTEIRRTFADLLSPTLLPSKYVTPRGEACLWTFFGRYYRQPSCFQAGYRERKGMCKRKVHLDVDKA